MHGTGDNVWIVSYDYCKNELPENLMMPLFAEDALIRCVNDSIENAQSFGYFPTTDYTNNQNAKKLLKNRRLIQLRTANFAFDKSKEILNVYFVPIIAKCDMHEFGINHDMVMTIDGELEIWTDFWDIVDRKIVRRIVNHDFSKFDYRVSIDLCGHKSKWPNKED